MRIGLAFEAPCVGLRSAEIGEPRLLCDAKLELDPPLGMRLPVVTDKPITDEQLLHFREVVPVSSPFRLFV